MSPPLCQIALSVTDLPRSHAWYTAAFGYFSAGGTNSFKGYIASKVQGVAGAASSCWWLMDGQAFFQIELFQFHSPEVRPMAADWRPCDIGYSSIGLWVRDFDATLGRLKQLGSTPVGDIMGDDGERRACVRDPDGVLLELFEADPLPIARTASAIPCSVVTASVTVSVADIEASQHYFCDVLGMELLPEYQLHNPEHEALWGMAGAQSLRRVLRAGDSLVELVQYTNPEGRHRRADYRISDQGVLNIALGYRERNRFDSTYNQCLAAGIKGNWRPLDLGNWKVVYVNDHQGFSVELLCVKPWWDGPMGFKRQPRNPALPVAGKRSVVVQQEFNTDRTTLWQALTDHANMDRWWPLGSSALLQAGTRDENGTGAIRRLHGLGLALEEEVTAWEEGRHYEYRVTRGAPLRHHHASVTLLPQADGGITVQWQITFQPAVPGTGALTHWALHKLLTRALHNLQRRLS